MQIPTETQIPRDLTLRHRQMSRHVQTAIQANREFNAQPGGHANKNPRRTDEKLNRQTNRRTARHCHHHSTKCTFRYLRQKNEGEFSLKK